MSNGGISTHVFSALDRRYEHMSPEVLKVNCGYERKRQPDTKRKRHVTRPIHTAFNHLSCMMTLFCFSMRLPPCLHPCCMGRTSSQMDKNQLRITLRTDAWRSSAQASCNKASETKFLSILMDHLPVLPVCGVIPEPTLFRATRAPHHLHELLAELCLLIAPASISHHP